METVRTIILVLHIIAGFTALTVGFVPFVAKKGGKWHNITGKIFYYAMVFVAISAFVLATMRFNPFLLMVGLLTFYSTITGYRGLKLMRQKATKGERRDWALLIFCTLLLVVTIWQTLTLTGTDNSGVIILVSVFASSLSIQLVADLRIFSGKKPMKGKAWIRYHISRISGSYIAAVTAFLVNNIHTDPEFIAWLLPTALGMPAIAYFQRQYSDKKKAIRRPAPKAVVQRKVAA